MSCYHPLTGFQKYSGAPLSFTVPAGLAKRLMIPCGQCHGCRLDRSASWAARCMHEASMHKHNQFVTLTYRDNPITLVPRDFQLFLKRLRRVQPFRFFGCGEYGDVYGRPHYHVLLFGFDCVDRVRWRISGSGSQSFRSDVIEREWGHGHCEVGDVTFESAAYVARYAMKKLNDGSKVREIIDVSSGEIFTREHEFLRMSLKPGIGASWYEKFWREVYPEGTIRARGAFRKSPKYYDGKFKLQFPGEYDKLVMERLKKYDFEDNSPERLRVKEIVEKAKVKFLKRSL